MNKKSNKKGVGVLVLLVAILIVIIGLFNISRLTFIPEAIRESVSTFIGIYYSKSIVSSITFEAVGAALLTLFATWVIASIVKFITNNIKYKKNRAETLHQLVGKLVVYAIYIVGAIVALGCLGVNTTAILVSAGVVGIIVGFGAQSLIEDIITGLFIILEGEFAIGDIITIDGFRGEVKTIGLRTVSIEDLGGNVRIINNSEISSLINLSDNTSVAVVNVPVSYEDSLEKAEAAVKEALSELPSEYPDIFKEAPVYKGVDQLIETHFELMVVANVAEENIYNARRIMQREIRYSCEKAGLTTPCKD
ncbi:MAG: mechanosensitive ion channel [Clostridia bacterium]|nr:mechanosensitive ion channel [Clostridia bacterium]